MKKLTLLAVVVCLLASYGSVIAEEVQQGRFAFAGYSGLSFTESKQGTEGLQFKLAPILLFQLSDRFHVEAELEFDVNDAGEAEAKVEYLDLHYYVNDYGTLTFGKFLLPFATFGKNLHPSWINKLPTMPAIYGGHHSDGLMQGLIPLLSDVGVAYQHVVPLSAQHRLFIDSYIVNGPGAGGEAGHGDAGHDEAAVDDHDEEADHAGDDDHDADADQEEDADADHADALVFELPELNFEGKIHDRNSSKAFGGRLAYAYLPGFEAGISYYRGAYDDDANLDFKAEAIDLSYSGRYFSIRGEYIRTATDSVATMSLDDHLDALDGGHDEEEADEHDEDAGHDDGDADHDLEEALVQITDAVKRDGWYVQGTLQLRGLDKRWLTPVELVLRHSRVNKISAAKRWTFGVNYWWGPSAVIKAAFDTTELPSGRKVNRFITQIGYGF